MRVNEGGANVFFLAARLAPLPLETRPARTNPHTIFQRSYRLSQAHHLTRPMARRNGVPNPPTPRLPRAFS